MWLWPQVSYSSTHVPWFQKSVCVISFLCPCLVTLIDMFGTSWKHAECMCHILNSYLDKLSNKTNLYLNFIIFIRNYVREYSLKLLTSLFGGWGDRKELLELKLAYFFYSLELKRIYLSLLFLWLNPHAYSDVWSWFWLIKNFVEW